MFRSGMRSFVSWATDRPGGFRDDDVALIDAVVPAFSLRLELESATFAVESLLSTYLGRDAAARVLGGEFKRGSGSRIQAVIWTADLRGFTVLVDEHGVEEAMQTLDEYFGCVAAPIGAHGGEILKFVGDAVLAVFPIGDEPARAVCARALAALDDATAARVAVDDARAARGRGPLRFGIALHVGEVFYGNIGVPGRLDFTVIGPAVNEACRVEEMTKQLGTPILATDAFVRAAETDRATPVGEHAIAGVAAPIRLHALRTGRDPA